MKTQAQWTELAGQIADACGCPREELVGSRYGDLLDDLPGECVVCWGCLSDDDLAHVLTADDCQE